MVKVKTLKNGLRIIVNDIKYVKSVTMGILVGAGSAYESEDENGISHFIEHVNFKGTKKRTAFEISDDSDCIGSQLNAFTAKDSTCYYIKCLDEHTSEAFEILSDLFLESVYPEEELDKERGVIAEEINMTEDTPDELCIDAVASAHFGRGGYGATILGPLKNIEKFSKNDVLAYKKKYYSPTNTVISFAGHITFERACGLVEKYFGDFNGLDVIDKKSVNTECLCENVAISKKIEQAHIALSLPSIDLSSPEKAAMLCISSALGGGMSSRLFQEVREKRGLAYTVYSYLSSYRETGVFYVYAGVNPKNYKDAYNCITEQIENVCRKGITEKELARAKEQIKGSTALSGESTSSLMISYGKRLLICNDIFDIDAELKKLSSLELDEVNAVAKKNLSTEKMATAIVADRAKALR